MNTCMPSSASIIPVNISWLSGLTVAAQNRYLSGSDRQRCELEMALSVCECPGFVLVLPVYELSKDETTASLRWIGAVVRQKVDRSKIDIDDILEPDDWVRLSAVAWNETWPFATWPIIVHLAGCPLIKLPKALPTPPSSQLSRLGAHQPETGPLEAAILLDEYSAIQQHSSEILIIEAIINVQ